MNERTLSKRSRCAWESRLCDPGSVIELPRPLFPSSRKEGEKPSPDEVKGENACFVQGALVQPGVFAECLKGRVFCDKVVI